MGCVTTKLLNDGGTESGGDLVKTVYRADANIYEEIKKPSKVVSKITDHLTKPNIFTKNHVKRKNAEADKNCDVPKIKHPKDDIAAVHTTPLVVDPIEAKRERFKAKFDPRVTSKYDIKALIGRGSFSRVVRVERRTTREPYAIKMVDRKKGAEVCEAELSVLGRVRHANVIQLIEVIFNIFLLSFINRLIFKLKLAINYYKLFYDIFKKYINLSCHFNISFNTLN